MIQTNVSENLTESVTLSYPATAHRHVMRVIGDFDNWSAPGRPMKLSQDNLTYTLTLRLDPGVYRYVFWEEGSSLPAFKETDKRVQVLILPPKEYRLQPGFLNDGLITASGVLHQTTTKFVKRINAFTYELMLRTRRNDVVRESVAVWSLGGEQKNYPLKFAGFDPLFDYYRTKVVVSGEKTFFYRFLLDDGNGTRTYDKGGLSEGILGSRPFEIDPNTFQPT